MLGMSFASFLSLTIIAAVVAVAYHYGLRYRFVEGVDALFGKMIVAWVGAWVGSPVFGHWLWRVENVYIVPALLGGIAAVHLHAMTMKVSVKLRTTVPLTQREEPARSKTAIAA